MRSTPRLLAFATAATLLLVTQFALACLWDRDTLKSEAAQLPGIAEIITGRFERQPPKYYEMRLARIAALPEVTLDELDDAAVACDRLGKNDEAIAWMDRKRAKLEQLKADDPAVKTAWYRYHANIGTFYAHRWLRTGADQANTTDLATSEEHITQAIVINPDAHFGRERYQLAAIRWLRSGPNSKDGKYESFLGQVMSESPITPGKRVLPSNVVDGVAGLIVLGDAWQSIDVFWALGAAINARGEGVLAELAKARMNELIAAGRKSIDPAFAMGEPPHMWLEGMPFQPGGGEVDESVVDDVTDYYTEARAASEKWQANRWKFMEARFAEGQHPDTHPSFWEGWDGEVKWPSMPDMGHNDYSSLQIAATIAIVSLLGFALLFFVRYVVIKSRRARS